MSITRLLLNCDSTNENLDGYDRAVVDLSQAYAGLILRRVEAFAACGLQELHEMRFHDTSVQYLNDEWCEGDGEPFDTLMQTMYEREVDFIEMPADTEIPESWHARSEGDYMVIRANRVLLTSPDCFSVCWVCRPKHTDDHCETADIDMQTIRAVAGE